LVLRSYKNPYGSRDLIDHCLIWEACRATSAAPTFFAPLTIRDPETDKQRSLIDGGIVYNNPVSLVHRESQDLWPNTTPLLISIGTGLKQEIEFKGPVLSIAKSLAEIATETESTHNKFKNGSGKELANKNKYFRFNVPKIATIGMEEYQKLKDLEKETKDYISNHASLIAVCVEKMLETATPGM
jgi:predicted acylesterase/phospholipase RssA